MQIEDLLTVEDADIMKSLGLDARYQNIRDFAFMRCIVDWEMRRYPKTRNDLTLFRAESET